MSNWADYKREEPTRGKEGVQRCVVVSAEEGVTKDGVPKIMIKVKQSDTGIVCTKHVVKGDWFNKTMTEFFDAFPEIEDGDFNFVTWVGAEGAASFKINNNGYLEIGFFISPNDRRVKDLPPFKGSKPEKIEINALPLSEEEDDDDGELPFL